MKYLEIDKLFTKKWFKQYALILTGSFILAIGYVFFITPYQIIPGGVFGIGIVVNYLTKDLISFAPGGFPIGLFGLLMNIPLTIIGIKVLGAKFGLKTIVGFILSSLFIDLITWVWGYSPLVEDDALLSSIFGGVLIGFGVGLIFKSRATSGGSDIIAMILSKYSSLTPGTLLIYVDSVIVLLGLVVFKDWAIPLYSLITIFVTGKIADLVLEGISYNKTVFIISEKHSQIKDKLLFGINRGGTYIQARGMYSNQEKNMIFTNVNRRELVALQEFIKEIDHDAFVTVLDAKDIIGDGFRSIYEF